MNFTYSTRFLTNVAGGLELKHFWLDVTITSEMHGSGGLEFNHFWLDVTKTSKTSKTSGFCTDVTLDVHFHGATLARAACSQVAVDLIRSGSIWI